MAALVVATIAFLLPWVNRAFEIDEPLFLWSAEQILRAPSDFYGGQLNWYGSQQPFAQVIKNPPLNAFYLAAVGRFAGFGERPLHLAMLPWSVAVIVGTYVLARRWGVPPLGSAALTLATPAVLVSSMSVMCDVPMLALWMWGLILWLRGLAEQRPASLAASVVLMALCALTKYLGVALVPLALVAGLLERRRPGGWLLWLAIPVAASIAFEFYLRDKYGTGAFLDAAGYATKAVGENRLSFLGRGLVTLLFAGGALLPLSFLAPWLWSGRELGSWGAVTLALGAAFLVAGAVASGGASDYPLRTPAGVRWGALAQVTWFAVTGLQILALLARELWSRRDTTAVLLVLWIAGVLVFAGWINWSINVRSILPAVPAVAILAMRQIAARAPVAADSARRRLAIPWIAGLVLSLAVCWADYSSAQANRAAAAALIDRYSRHQSGSELWFSGHWGLQYYLQRAQARPIDLRGSDLLDGDVLVIPEDNPGMFEVPAEWKIVQTLEEPVCGWLTTTSLTLQAAFYSSVLGPVPYYCGHVPPRKYFVYDPFRRAERER
ncbi:MAG: glycosyltransferase family 39 protein [Planctomycetaceae bacterium]|nr:glycosyltransferase family 39 protein [Planctomycetaceae bacterium]